MTNKPKAIGTQGESAVVRVFKDAGFRAKRLTLHGSSDVGDIDIGIDSVCIEVKSGKAAESASDGKIEQWLIETDIEKGHAGADFGILVAKRRGIGAGNAGKWWAIMRHDDLAHLEWTTLPSRGDLILPGRHPVRLHLENLLPLLKRLS